MGTQERGIFLRKASGVVRNVGAFDVFNYNLGMINIGIGIAYILLFGPAFYGGVDLVLGLLLVVMGVLPTAVGYYIFSITMPRSGGEYTFISRGLNGVLGFVMSFDMVVWFMFYTGWSAGAMAYMGLSPFLQYLSSLTGRSDLSQMAVWFSGSTGFFLFGTGMIIFSAAVLIMGMKAYVRLNNIAVMIAVVGILLVIGLLFAGSREQFVAALPAGSGGLQYDTVINKAVETGWAPAGGSLLGSMLWPYYPLAYSICSCVFSGEIKKVGRSQLAGILGSLAFSAVLILLLIAGAYRTIGYDFLGAIGWNYYVNPAFSTPVIPWIGLLATMLTDNWVLATIVHLSFFLWAFFWVAGCMMYNTRAMLAWGLDRLMPARLGYVSPRFNTPVVATVISAVVGVIFLAMFAFTDWLVTLVGDAGMVPTFIAVGLAMITLPYVKKDVFQRSPANWRIAGIPVISLLGIATVVFQVVMFWPFYTDPVGGAVALSARISALAVPVTGFIIYFAMREYRKRQGIKVELAFREIPVE